MGHDLNTIKDPRLRARIMAILAGGAPVGGQASERPGMPSPASEAPRLAMSTDEEKLNKTERAFLAYLRAKAYPCLHIQAVTLKIAHDCRLTADFTYFDPARSRFTFVDVKGFQREDALIKIKVAARMFPEFDFVIVKKSKAGWDIKPVSP